MNDDPTCGAEESVLDRGSLAREPIPAESSWEGPVIRLRNRHPTRIVWLSARLPGALVVPAEAALRPGECATFITAGPVPSGTGFWTVAWRHPALGLGGSTRTAQLTVARRADARPAVSTDPPEMCSESV